MSEIQTSRPRATMKEVAELAGTSLKTVSRVINGEAHVTPELTEKVKAAAAKLQFRRISRPDSCVVVTAKLK